MSIPGWVTDLTRKLDGDAERVSSLISSLLASPASPPPSAAGIDDIGINFTEHLTPIERLYINYAVTPSVGLSSDGAARRLDLEGENTPMDVMATPKCFQLNHKPFPPPTAEWWTAVREKCTPTAIVLRDGKPLSVPAILLVVGDIIFLAEGDMIHADIRVIKTLNEGEGGFVTCSAREREDVASAVVSNKKGASAEFIKRVNPAKSTPHPMRSPNLALYGDVVLSGACVGVVVKVILGLYFPSRLHHSVKHSLFHNNK
jgi:hypothetical protein